MTLATTVFVDKTERVEVYLVPPSMRHALLGELKPVLLTLTITNFNSLLVWPVPLPDEQGRRSAWHETARDAAERAKTKWIKMVSDQTMGAYRLYEAQDKLPDPIWPEKPFAEFLESRLFEAASLTSKTIRSCAS